MKSRDIRERCGNQVFLLEGGDQSASRRLGHIERMEEGRLTKRIYRADVDGTRKRGRSKRRWRDGGGVCGAEANIFFF